MTTKFSEFNLHPELMQAITDLGYETPTPIQEGMIPLMMSGKDVIGQAQTGTGKTAAFAFPILHNLQHNHKHVQSLVLAPTRELALQVAGAFIEFGSHTNVRVLAVYGGQPYGIQINQLKRGVDVVVGTPGRLMDLMKRHVLDLSHVRTVVLDEADEMLSMGFIEDIETILAETPATRQTALFSATMPSAIRNLADRYMNAPQSVTIKREQATGPAITQNYYLVNSRDKIAALTRLFDVEAITSALIFARTRAGTGELANELTVRGFPAEALNGDLSQDTRERILNRFRQNQIKVLVATDVAARGLDIEDISHVFNFDLPEDPEIYVHRIGRTGRAGKGGIAISLVSPSEKRRLRDIESFTRQKLSRVELPTEDQIKNHRETQLLEQMKVWLQRGRCKRERELVEKLVAAGNDMLDVAAVALKLARADEKQKPIAAVAEVKEYERRPERFGGGRRREGSDDRPRREYSGDRPRREHSREHSDERPRRDVPTPRSPRRGGDVSHEEGMVRLKLALGRKDDIAPKDIVGAIAAHAKIPGYLIGKIYIEDKFSYVDVPEAFEAAVLKKSKITIRKHPLDLQRA